MTGIGGMIAQGVLRRLRACNRDLRLVGINTKAFSTGNYLCDAVMKVPPAVAAGYVDLLRDFCRRETVSLIIPCTDAEVMVLSQVSDGLPPIAASSAHATAVCYDKYKTSQILASAGISFAQSFLPSLYNGCFNQVVVKPRTGSGSRSVHFNPRNPAAFSDDYIVQELLQGEEITIAFFRCRNGTVLGPISMRRELENGATRICEVTDAYDGTVFPLVQSIGTLLDIRGSCNIQAIVKNNASITPFEINCRISGTHAMRVHFGFDEVAFLLADWIDNVTPPAPSISYGVACRVTREVVYRGKTLEELRAAPAPFFEAEH
ncbi:MAG: ATP-grasp domain-containing protein [Alphaproteobacteria bacterium]|nr:ATP-grasp domain-containing protein [Alphaproteobacteria bacterium]